MKEKNASDFCGGLVNQMKEKGKISQSMDLKMKMKKGNVKLKR